MDRLVGAEATAVKWGFDTTCASESFPPGLSISKRFGKDVCDLLLCAHVDHVGAFARAAVLAIQRKCVEYDQCASSFLNHP